MKTIIPATCLSFVFFFLSPFPVCSCSVRRKTPAATASEDKIFVLNKSQIPQTEEGVWSLADVDISNVSKDKKLIAFTFDDAPVSGFENLVAVFAEYNKQNPDCRANATVFYNGTYLRENPVGGQAALTVGFEYANHSDNHLDLSKQANELIKKEIDEVNALLKSYDNKSNHLFRPPYGKLKNESKTLVNAPIINWSIDTLDWTGKTADEIFNTVFENRASGAIVLMHDGFDTTVQAVKRLLPALKEVGYQVVSVSQIAKVNEVSFKYGSVYARARKASER